MKNVVQGSVGKVERGGGKLSEARSAGKLHMNLSLEVQTVFTLSRQSLRQTDVTRL